jgi:hypothetical protein
MRNSKTFDLAPLLASAQSFIGKTIVADGWQYDYSGFMSGVITSVINGNTVDAIGFPMVEITVTKSKENSMDSYKFTINQINTLLKNGELPVPNKFLNSGTYAKIK